MPALLYDSTGDLHGFSGRGAELAAAIGKLGLDPDRHLAAVMQDTCEFVADSEAGRDVEASAEELLS